MSISNIPINHHYVQSNIRIAYIGNINSPHFLRWIKHQNSNLVDVAGVFVLFGDANPPSLQIPILNILPTLLRKLILGSVPFDVIHAHYLGWNGLFGVILSRLFNVPLICTAWGSDVLVNYKKTPFHRFALSLIFKSSTLLTTDSKTIYVLAKKYIPPEKLLFCMFGIDSSFFLASLSPREKLKFDPSFFSDRYSLSQSQSPPFIILSARNHESIYNIDIILKAFAYYVVDNPNSILIIAGFGPQTSYLKRLAASLGVDTKVCFFGKYNSHDFIYAC